MPSAKQLPSHTSSDQSLALLIDDLTQRLERGEQIDIEVFVAQHAEHADPLRRLIPSLLALADMGASVPQADGISPVPFDANGQGCLGDFRLLREIGRGGMGVVYEAEQVSLGRRVALKVLPFAALLDERQLARFKNEARAAGSLHHTNIVPVHFVGCERGVHFYAMQYIEGQTLAQVIIALRAQSRMLSRKRSQEPGDRYQNSEEAVGGQGAGVTADWKSEFGSIHQPPTTIHSPPPSPQPLVPSPSLPDTVAVDALETILTEQSTNRAAHYRTIARLGIQAAEALEHAHQHGVIHRDIKPANLMLDATGNLWIADFGLARFEVDAGVTMTGDVLGTLRYMSPEQALGQRGLVDRRSDVYSLGVTLYELLASEPPFAADDRAKLLHQIAHEEPRLRRRDRTIPADLETIVHKALEKNPSDRYATAEALADDLRRFVEGEPIRARPWSLAKRATRWVHRHQSVAWATAVTLLVSAFAVAGNIGWAVRDRAARQTEAESTAGSVLNEAERLLARADWPEALVALERAEVLLAGYSASSLTARAQQLRKDAEMVQRLEEIRHSLANQSAHDAVGNSYDPESDRKYSEAFREYGIDVQALRPSDAAERIKLSRVRFELATALDYWAGWRRRFAADDTGWKPLVEIALAADPDPLRNSLRDALKTPLPQRKAALIELAASADGKSMPPATVILLCRRLLDDGAPQQAFQLLRAAHRRHLNNYNITFLLARSLSEIKPPQFEEAIRYYTAALAIRPQFSAAYNNLGNALADKGLLDEAIDCYEEAIRLFPSDPYLHYNLGLTLEKKGLRTEAIACFREAIRLQPDLYQAHGSLGALLHQKGLSDEAMVSFKEVIRLKPDNSESHRNLGIILTSKGRLDDAIASLKQSIRLQPDAADPHRDLGKALIEKGRLDEAIASFREAIRLKPDYVYAYIDLGLALHRKGMSEEAIACYRKAIECDPRNRVAYYNLGQALHDMGRRDEAIAVYRQEVKVDPNNGALHHYLGIWLREAGAVDEAIVCAKESVRLRTYPRTRAVCKAMIANWKCKNPK